MIELPLPAKILWPNGRGHHMAKHRAFREHKRWAYLATVALFHREALKGLAFKAHKPLRWSVTVYPKTRNRIDRDNALSSLKAYQDGMALAMGLDDRDFETPTLHFAEPVKNGRVVIVLEAA